MNVEKRGIVIGMALGDGYVQVRSHHLKRSPGAPREERTLTVVHGAAQRAYCEWKAARLAWALGCQPMNVTSRKNGPGGKYLAYGFSKNHPYFGQVRTWLYREGKKTYTRRVLDMLTPEGLAIWYMDDGHARRNTNTKGFVSSVSTNIATMCSEAEVGVVIDWFKDRFDIEFRARCKPTGAVGHQFFIECNTEASRKFAKVIAPHVPECMLYKLSHVADLGSHECRAPSSECTACGAPIFDNRRKGLCPRCYSRKYYREVARVRDGRTPNPSGFYIKDGDEIVRPNGNNEPLEAGDKEPSR